MATQGHKGWFVGLLILNLIVLLTVYFFNAVQAQSGFLGGIFKNTVSNQSDKYYLQITPAGWTFSIWGFIYTWQAIWVLYSLVLLCRSTPDGPAYLNPVLINAATVVLYILSNGCNIAWLFLFDRDHLEGAFAALAGIAILLISSLAVSYRTLDRASPSLVQQNRTLDIWLVRAFVHNGLGIYATWTSIATLLNMAMVIRYRSDPVIGDETAATVALGVLSLEIVVFITTDLFLLDRYSRYTLTPYLVVVIALSGSIAKNLEDGARNSIFTAALLAVGSVGLVLKLVMTVYRHATRDPYSKHNAYTLDNYKGGQRA